MTTSKMLNAVDRFALGTMHALVMIALPLFAAGLFVSSL